MKSSLATMANGAMRNKRSVIGVAGVKMKKWRKYQKMEVK